MTKKMFQSNHSGPTVSLLIFVLFPVLALSSCATKESLEMERLSEGKPVTKKIANDEIQSYTVGMEKDQFLALEIEQRDVDTIARAVAPDGTVIGEFDTPTSGRGTEIVRIGADAAGDYKIEIYTLSENAEPGEYTIKIADFRALDEGDRKILEAVRLHQQADRLRAEESSRPQSIPLYEQSLAIWRELGERKEEGNTLRAMGFAFQRMNDLEKAKDHFGKALEIWEETGDYRSAAFTKVIFGVMSKKQNDLEKGLDYDLQAQTLWERSGDANETVQNMARIGSDYTKMKNKEKAFEFYDQAIEKSRSLGSKSLEAYVLGGCGDAHAAFGNKDTALDFYRRAQDLWKNLNQQKAVENLQEKIAKLQTA